MKYFIRPAGILFIILFCSAPQLAAAGDSTTFKASGKPLLTLFSNFHSEITGGKQGRTGFALTRVYLGYQYAFHRNFTAAVKLDIGSPDDLGAGSGIKRYAYFKNAYLEYHTGRFQWSFGLVSTKMFKLPEKYWGHRYVAKPYMDRYRFGPSADLGMVIAYRFLPGLTADFSLLNGEGYSRIQMDTAFKYALGLTWQPAKKWVIRGYGDIYSKSFTRSVLSLFTGYRSDHLTAGAEFDYYLNAGPQQGMDKWGTSASFSWNFREHLQYFGRLDYLNALMRDKNREPWDPAAPGTWVVTGLQYTPVSHVHLALDYRLWTPASAGIPASNWIFFNIGVHF